MTPRARAWLEYAALCAYGATVIVVCVLAVLAASGCQTVYIISGDGSIATEQRIGRKFGPIGGGDSDVRNTPKQTPEQESKP